MLINEANYLNEETKDKVEALIESAYADAENTKGWGGHLNIPLDEIKKQLVEDAKAGGINPEFLPQCIQMLQLQENYMNETNFSANVASFVPKLPMLLRRIQSNMFAFDVAGVQPVPTPDTSIYMLRAQYSGDTSTTARTANRTTSQIVIMQKGSVDATVSIGSQLTSANSAQGTVVYTETRPDEDGGEDIVKAVVNVTSSSPSTFVKAEKVDVGGTYTSGTNDLTVLDVVSNEAGFKQILSGYSGPYTTANGEALGTEMRQLRVNIVKQQITVETRKLKAELTLELIQDMKSQHNAQADKELMYYLEKEISDDINIEIIEAYKDISLALGDFVVTDTTNENSRHDTDKYVRLYNRILKDKRDLSARNQRGSANIIIATSGVITAMEALGKFKEFDLGGGVMSANNYSMPYVGTLIDGTKVYQDFFTENATGKEYYMPIYKGAGMWDAGVIYCPLTPVSMVPLSATDPDTLQPIIGLMTRQAIEKNSLFSSDASGASDYCSIRYVTFTNSALA